MAEDNIQTPRDAQATETRPGATPEEHAAAESATGHLVLSAVTPSRLAAPTPREALMGLSRERWWMATQKVATDWQATSVWADFWELLAPRVQHGRGHELAGLIADGGERLALAHAATTEAELWRIYRQGIPPDARDLDELKKRAINAANEMAHRAMGELAMYYLLATGHTLANVTARALALDSRLHPLLLDVLGGWYPVGSSDPKDWLSLNRDTTRLLRRAAKKASSPAAQTLAEPISELLMTRAWQELDQLRGAHYHRRRPQSAGISGVPLASPWTFSRDASQMDGGGDQYTDGDGLADANTSLARRVLAELILAMPRLYERVQTVIEEVKETRNAERTRQP